MHQLKASADDARAPEQPLNLFGRGVGGDVEILRFDPEQQVAHGATDQEGEKAGLLQGACDADGVVRHQCWIDAVVGMAKTLWPTLAALARRGFDDRFGVGVGGGFGFAAENLTKQCFDH